MSWSLETHVRAVSALHIALGALFALGLGVLATLGVMAIQQQVGITLPGAVTGGVVAAALASLAALHLAAGFGFWHYRRWSRALVFLLSFVALLNVPAGTVVGGYSLWVLYHTRGW